MASKKRQMCENCGSEIFDRPQNAKYCKECSEAIEKEYLREYRKQDYMVQNYVVCGLLLAPEECLQRAEQSIEEYGKVVVS